MLTNALISTILFNQNVKHYDLYLGKVYHLMHSKSHMWSGNIIEIITGMKFMNNYYKTDRKKYLEFVLNPNNCCVSMHKYHDNIDKKNIFTETGWMDEFNLRFHSDSQW